MLLSISTWQTLQQSADRARLSAEHPQAIELYTQALAQPDVPWEAHCAMVFGRATSREMIGDSAAIDAELSALAQEATAKDDDIVHCTALKTLARTLRFTGDLARCLDLGKQAVVVAERTGNADLLASALSNVGRLFIDRGEMGAAQDCLKRVEALSPQEMLAQIEFLYFKAYLFYHLGQLPQSNQAATEGLALARRAGFSEWIANFLNTSANSSPDSAISGSFYEQALAIFEAVGNRRGQCLILSNIGAWLMTLGVYRRGMEKCQQSIEMAQVLHQDLLSLTPLANICIIQAELGDFLSAQATADQAQALILKTGAHAMEANLNLNRSLIALYQRKLQDANAYINDPSVIALANQASPVQAARLACLAVIRRLEGDRIQASRMAQEAASLISPADFGYGEVPIDDVLWYCFRAAAPEGPGDLSDEAWKILDLGRRAVLAPVENMSDAGLRRCYLHRVTTRRLLLSTWLQQAPGRASADEMDAVTALLQRPGRLNDIFQRLLAVGVRLNAERDPARLPDEVVEDIAELTGAERIALILLDEKGQRQTTKVLLPRAPNAVTTGKEEAQPDPGAFLAEIEPWLDKLSATRQGYVHLIHPEGELIEQRSILAAPLLSQGRLVGLIYCDLRGAFGRFEQEDLELLGVLANQSAVAVENADWSATLEKRVAERTEELKQSTSHLEQRTAELTIINRVQEGLVSQLDFQAIIDLVGNELMRVFPPPEEKARLYSVFIALLDAQTNLIHFPYWADAVGDRFTASPMPLGEGITSVVIQSHKPLVLKSWKESVVLGARVFDDGLPDEFAQSWLGVPVLVGERVTGVIGIQDPREDLFTEADVRLMSTLAASLGVALENARLFAETQRLLEETRQRNGELSIINEIQLGLASRLDFQSIVDLVGDKLREVFQTPDLLISWYLEAEQLVQYLYTYQHGVRLEIPSDPLELCTVFKKILATRKPVIWETAQETQGFDIVPGTDVSKCGMAVPIISGDRILGRIQVENYEREHAYSESELRLLNTIAASLGTALENARLFAETQRLLEETRQRNSELAIINEIQQGLAARLDFQAIVDLVGDKLREVFQTPDLAIDWLSANNDTILYLYSYEHGQRLNIPPMPVANSKIMQRLIDTRQSFTWNTSNVVETFGIVPGTDTSKSGAAVPIISSKGVIGRIQIENFERENAFGESEMRLLTTIAGALGTALENARLFAETQRLLEETRQRNNELSLITSIQQGLAARLDFQAIVDLVGDKLREVFQTKDLMISWYDEKADLVHYLYSYEHGQRITVLPVKPRPDGMIRTRQPRIWNTEAEGDAVAGAPIPGTDASKSGVSIPIISSDRIIGGIQMENYERENAYGEADLRLLNTIAGSLGAALQNAYLFNETERLLKETEARNRELAIISRVGQSLAGQLDPQGIFDLVGEELRQVFDAQVVAIITYDHESNLCNWRYSIEKGVRQSVNPRVPAGFSGYIIRTRQPLLITQNLDQRAAELGSAIVAGEAPKSYLGVPLIAGGEVTGLISLQNIDREKAFSESDQQLLSTLALNMGVALENARLYQETQRHAVEMAALAEVGREISATLELPDVLERIAGKACEMLAAATSAVYLLQGDGQTLKAIAAAGYSAHEILADMTRLGEGIIGNIVQKGEAECIRDTVHDPRSVHVTGTEETPSDERLLVAPLLVQGKAIGALAVWRNPKDPPFNPAELSFSIGLAQQAAVAIDNARLFEAAQESQRRMADIIDFLPDATFVVDREGRVIAWNRSIEEMTGVKAGDILGKGNYEYSLPFYSERRPILIDLVLLPDDHVEQKYANIHRQGATLIGESAVPNLRGEAAYLYATASVLRNAKGEVVGAIETIRDITDRKRTEQELEKAKAEADSANQAKSAFLAMMSHEIRTPMNAIIGMSGLLLDTDLNGQQREFAEIIRNSGDALLTIINDILDFSKIEAGKLDLEYTTFDLRECLESAIDLLATHAAQKGIDLAVEVAPNLPHAITSDVTRLRQVLLNLLNNAVKFTEKGEVVVSASLEEDASQTQGPLLLHFAVRDTGIGIPADRLDRLFQSFSQVDASTARRYGGTGLGLAISKRLAEMMGGRLWVESQVGVGSVFHFTIQAEAAKISTRTRREGEQPRLAGRRLVVVDDNPTNRRIIILQTQNWGMIARETGSPAEALSWIQRGDPFDIAILDMHMSEMDGLTLGREIRKVRDAKSMPLVMLSSVGAHEPDSDQVDWAAYLTKPIKQSQLFNLLASIFGEAESPQPRQAPKAAAQADSGMAARCPLTILLAEDNAYNQKLAMHLLGQLGYRADLAGNGLEAIQSLERQSYHVILMDVQMPEMDGLEASRQICTRWTRGERPLIIAMTANAMQGDREMCLAAGMDDYISKPIRIAELAAALERAYLMQPQAPQNQTEG